MWDSIDNMVSSMSKKKLLDAYKNIFGIEYVGRSTKNEIAYRIWSYMQDAERTKDLTKLLGR